MSRTWARLGAALRRWSDRGRRDDELNEELHAFVELEADANVRAGMTPEAARRAALIALGGREHVKEQVRDAQAGARWEAIVRDVKYAIRSLRRERAFSLSVIGNLSLGLAATIVALAFINGALLRRFPGVSDQRRLVTLGILESTPLGSRPRAIALADYPQVMRTLSEGLPSLDGLASFTESDVAVALPQPRSLPAAFVSPNYFEVLGIRPAAGRTFAPGEREAAAPLAVIGYDLWTREFGRDRSVPGRPIHVGGHVFQIIGVGPPGFRGTTEDPVHAGVDVWLPIALADRVGDPLSVGRGGLVFLDDRPGERVIRYVGHLRDRVRTDRVETELAIAARRTVTRTDGRPVQVIATVSSLSRLNDRQDAGQIVAVILAIPMLVLLIACVNAANLFVVRASRRGREVAVRLALGASRLQVVRQLITESLVLALAAVAAALPLAWLGLRLAGTLMVMPMPIDGTVVAGAIVIAFVTAIGFGLAPALQAAGQQPSAVLGTSPAGSGGTRRESRVPPGPGRRAGCGVARPARHRVPADVGAGIAGDATRHRPSPPAAGLVQPGAASCLIF
jgi:hypothetical protein